MEGEGEELLCFLLSAYVNIAQVFVGPPSAVYKLLAGVTKRLRMGVYGIVELIQATLFSACDVRSLRDAKDAAPLL
jgi:hypothetical protein